MLSKARSKLDEDGLRLWQAALQNNVTLEAVPGAPSLMDVFPIAVDLLADNLDLLGSITSVIRSYLVLDFESAKILQVRKFVSFDSKFLSHQR